MIIINPGTEPQENHSQENAIKVAKIICSDLGIDESHFRLNPESDDTKGWYGFIFSGAGGEVEVDIPGIDPEVVTKSEPWVSPRLYVGGNSWLYGYALGFISRAISKNII